jgi:uncharacterized membrane protein
MDKEMLQKVLGFIREGATATSGPAKWGFEQMCTYRSSVALGELVTLALGVILSLVAVVCLVPSIKKGMNTKDSGFWCEVGAPVVGIILSCICAASLVAFLCRIPTDLATIRNPAGSVLSEFVNH